MPRHEIIYDPVAKESPEWRHLYGQWLAIRKSKFGNEFELFNDFYNWAMSNGYVFGARLIRIDQNKPFGPNNCFHYLKPKPEQKPDFVPMDEQWIRKWNETVNRIRIHYGMKPLCTEEKV